MAENDNKRGPLALLRHLLGRIREMPLMGDPPYVSPQDAVALARQYDTVQPALTDCTDNRLPRTFADRVMQATNENAVRRW